MSSYCAALGRLYDRVRFGERLDLATPRALHAALGGPLDAYRSVIVAGTNGKGSTAAFIEALLRGRGVRTGLFTSPHLVSFRERIRVDGGDLSEADVVRLAGAVQAVPVPGPEPTFFEVVWGMAARAFADAGVEVAIWEVGLGGRLDATNVCDAEVAAIAELSLDHTALLGSTLDAIAREKAAVCRPGRPAFTSATGPGLAALRGAAPQLVPVEPPPDLPPPPLPGAHQRRNAALALAVVEALGFTPDPADLRLTRWPGRAERFGDVILDCAHNPNGAEALAAWLDEARPGPVHLVFGAMMDKDVAGVAAPLAARAASVALVTPDYPRRLPAPALLPYFPGARIGGTVAEALAARPRDRVTLVTGSSFLVGEARALLTGADYPECGLRTLAR